MLAMPSSTSSVLIFIPDLVSPSAVLVAWWREALEAYHYRSIKLPFWDPLMGHILFLVESLKKPHSAH